MAFNIKNRHLLSLVNHSEREIKYLLDLSRDLKRAKYAGTEQPKLPEHVAHLKLPPMIRALG